MQHTAAATAVQTATMGLILQACMAPMTTTLPNAWQQLLPQLLVPTAAVFQILQTLQQHMGPAMMRTRLGWMPTCSTALQHYELRCSNSMDWPWSSLGAWKTRWQPLQREMSGKLSWA